MLRSNPVASKEKTRAHCLHCGQECTEPSVRVDDQVFCCAGCREVYQLIQQCDLGNFYQMREGNASKSKLSPQKEFEYLRDPEIRRRFIDFENDNHYRLSLHIPNVHCTACVYLLERMQRFLPEILEANVDFLRKEIQLKVAKPGPDLPEIARLLGQIGYPPDWQTKTHSASTAAGKRQQITRKMAVAGFSFGNIMLLSLPEYLSEHGIEEAFLSASTQGMSVLLSLPVVFYSASDYFTTAFEALKKRVIKLDIPIALGIAVLFLRSVYEILSGAGIGYLDSLSALVFFLLLGRLFQEKSFHHLHFDRDQQSFFPLAVLKIESGGKQTAADYMLNRALATDSSQEPDANQAVFSADEQATETEVGIHLLKAGDQIRVRHLEVVPADSLLTDSGGLIDYSFVTGESEPVACFKGDVIYAGGRIAGTSLRMEVLKPAADAYLMKLWNQNALENSNFEPEAFRGTADKIAQYFTPAVIIIALLGFGAWLPFSIETAFQVLSAVLIIACPCALALSAPLSLGHGLRLLARSNFFVRNTTAIDRLARIRCLVFDKTGTLSQQDLGPMSEENIEWSPVQQSMVQSVCRHSTHPLSKMLAKTLPFNPNHQIQLYDEQEGRGINALVDSHQIQIGQRIEAHNEEGGAIEQKNARAYSAPGNLVWVRIDGKELGYVHFKPIWRSGIEGSLHRLGIDYEIHLLSGDNPRDGERIAAWFPPGSALNFRQSPLEKKHYIGELSRKRAGGVAMIGDGLNDAGALQAADVGIAVSEKSGQFSPACDVILAGDALTRLPDILAFVRSIPGVLYINLAFSVIYNLAGLSFALGGTIYLVGALIMAYNLIRTAAAGSLLSNEPALVPQIAEESPDSLSWHRRLEGKAALFTVLVTLAILVGGIVEFMPVFLVKSNVPTLASVKPYTPLELHGRDVYIKEGCVGCHSQMIRPFRSETERYGEYSKAGEFVYDHPFLWGSKRTGPDLHRLGGKYPDSWHYNHMIQPVSMSPGSIMPAYPWLADQDIDTSLTRGMLDAMRTLGVPYSSQTLGDASLLLEEQATQITERLRKDGINARSHSEMVALIAYLQRLGTDIRQTTTSQNPTP